MKKEIKKIIEDEKKEEEKERKKKKENEVSCYKGKNLLVEEIYNPEENPPFLFVYLPDGKNIPVVVKEYQVNGKIIYPLEDENIEKEVVLLPSGFEEYGDNKLLISEIKQFINKYFDIVPFYEKLYSYYVLFTWVYDCFNVLPYIRVIGDTGTGKSRFLQVVGSLCYKRILCGGAITPAPIYRFTEIYHGTLIIDESDFKFSNEYQEIIKILNCGYMAGVPVLRCDTENKKFPPKGYDCFVPKIIANRNKFSDQALESRCITYQMKDREREDIDLVLPADFDKEALVLRNKLLLWRLRNYGKKEVKNELKVDGVEDRTNQIFLPLLSVIDDIDKEFREEVQFFMFDYNQELVKDREMTLEADILRVIIELREEGNLEPSIKEITNKYNENVEEEKLKITSKKAGNIIKRLGIEKKKRTDGCWHIVDDLKKIERLEKKYICILPKEDRMAEEISVK